MAWRKSWRNNNESEERNHGEYGVNISIENSHQPSIMKNKQLVARFNVAA
jgi:hypothetical protein